MIAEVIPRDVRVQMMSYLNCTRGATPHHDLLLSMRLAWAPIVRLGAPRGLRPGAPSDCTTRVTPPDMRAVHHTTISQHTPCMVEKRHLPRAI